MIMTVVWICFLVSASLLAGHLPEVDRATHSSNSSLVKSEQNSARKAKSKKGSTADRNKRGGQGPIDPDKPGGPRLKRGKSRKHHKKS